MQFAGTGGSVCRVFAVSCLVNSSVVDQLHLATIEVALSFFVADEVDGIEVLLLLYGDGHDEHHPLVSVNDVVNVF